MGGKPRKPTGRTLWNTPAGPNSFSNLPPPLPLTPEKLEQIHREVLEMRKARDKPRGMQPSPVERLRWQLEQQFEHLKKRVAQLEQRLDGAVGESGLESRVAMLESALSGD